MGGERASSEPAVDRETQRPQLGKTRNPACSQPLRPDSACCQLPPVPTGPACPEPRTSARARSLSLPVAELGLGYTSEETVIFRYCAGSCSRGARTQHGLTLARSWARAEPMEDPAAVYSPTLMWTFR